MEAIKNTKQYVDYQTQKSGGGCGCWAIGCGSIMFIMLLLCGGGFYTIFYSSAPLKLIERAIEENEDVEIEGLQGNFMSGFSIEELRFKTEGDEWSNLTNIKFKYKSSFFQSDRIIIEDISVDGGTIYANFEPNQSEFSMDPDIDSELEEARNEIESEMGNAFQAIKEVRIDLIRVANLKIINPETQATVTLDEIKYDGFHIEDGELVNLGNLLVESSEMNIKTTKSERFQEFSNSKRFVGTIKAQLDRRLTKDMPVEFDIAVDELGEIHYVNQFFRSAIVAERDGKRNEYTFNNFTPAEYFDTSEKGITPSNLDLQFQTSKGYLPETVEDEGSFELGQTRFSELTLDPNAPTGTAWLVGTGTVGQETVTATIHLSRLNPWGRIELSSTSDSISKEELWSQVVFGKSFEDLSDSRRESVDFTIIQNAPRRKATPPAVETMETEAMSDAEADEAEPLLPTDSSSGSVDR